MKRIKILLSLVLLVIVIGFPVSSDESVLIDFAKLTADMEIGENEATLIDFADKAGTGFTEAEKELMKTSLAIENWDIVLASSARTVGNEALSYTKEVPVKEDASRYPGETIMGIRIHFPEDPFNSWARVQPPFEIPAYMRKTTVQDDGIVVEDETDVNRTKFDSFGVVKNVGVIKSVSMNVYGSNFPNGLELVFLDQNNNEKRIFMNYLLFDGWKTLTWQNPNYVTEVRNREIERYPLYPEATPYVKLAGIVVYKDAEQKGGDVITYIKDISVTYDKAVLDIQRDINEEAIWGILDRREEARRKAEFSKLGELQVLRYLESKKMHSEEDIEAQEQNNDGQQP